MRGVTYYADGQASWKYRLRSATMTTGRPLVFFRCLTFVLVLLACWHPASEAMELRPANRSSQGQPDQLHPGHTGRRLLGFRSREQLQPQSTKPTKSNYVILTTARSSSTFLCRVVEAHPTASCFGEVLSDDVMPRIQDFITSTVRYGRQRQRLRPPTAFASEVINATKLELGYWPPKPMDIVEWLLTDQLCSRVGLCTIGFASSWCSTRAECEAGHNRRSKGFKVFYYHEHVEEVLDLCVKYNLPVIHLIRASSFRHSISAMVASRTHAWQVVGEKKRRGAHRQGEVSPFPIDMERLESNIRIHSSQVERFTRLLEEKAVPQLLTIFYEELRMRLALLPQRHALSYIYSFLDLDPKLARIDTIPTVKYSSMFNYTNLISNFDEVSKTYPYDACELEHGSLFE